MKEKSVSVVELEPIGIVISHGPQSEAAPTFFAYVWSEDPGPTLVGAAA